MHTGIDAHIARQPNPALQLHRQPEKQFHTLLEGICLCAAAAVLLVSSVQEPEQQPQQQHHVDHHHRDDVPGEEDMELA